MDVTGDSTLSGSAMSLGVRLTGGVAPGYVTRALSGRVLRG